jgi:hypothetical protein
MLLDIAVSIEKAFLVTGFGPFSRKCGRQWQAFCGTISVESRTRDSSEALDFLGICYHLEVTKGKKWESRSRARRESVKKLLPGSVGK